jgi:hypothetical protein
LEASRYSRSATLRDHYRGAPLSGCGFLRRKRHSQTLHKRNWYSVGKQYR